MYLGSCLTVAGERHLRKIMSDRSTGERKLHFAQVGVAIEFSGRMNDLRNCGRVRNQARNLCCYQWIGAYSSSSTRISSIHMQENPSCPTPARRQRSTCRKRRGHSEEPQHQGYQITLCSIKIENPRRRPCASSHSRGCLTAAAGGRKAKEEDCKNEANRKGRKRKEEGEGKEHIIASRRV